MDQKCKFHCGADGDVAAVRWTETLCQLLQTADSMKQEAQSKMSKVRVQRLIRSCDGCFMKRSACRSHRPISFGSCDPPQPSYPPPIHRTLTAALEEWKLCQIFIVKSAKAHSSVFSRTKPVHYHLPTSNNCEVASDNTCSLSRIWQPILTKHLDCLVCVEQSHGLRLCADEQQRPEEGRVALRLKIKAT